MNRLVASIVMTKILAISAFAIAGEQPQGPSLIGIYPAKEVVAGTKTAIKVCNDVDYDPDGKVIRMPKNLMDAYDQDLNRVLTQFGYEKNYGGPANTFFNNFPDIAQLASTTDVYRNMTKLSYDLTIKMTSFDLYKLIYIMSLPTVGCVPSLSAKPQIASDDGVPENVVILSHVVFMYKHVNDTYLALPGMIVNNVLIFSMEDYCGSSINYPDVVKQLLMLAAENKPDEFLQVLRKSHIQVVSTSDLRKFIAGIRNGDYDDYFDPSSPFNNQERRVK